MSDLNHRTAPEHAAEFHLRHIGPSPEEQEAMARDLGAESLDLSLIHI